MENYMASGGLRVLIGDQVFINVGTHPAVFGISAGAKAQAYYSSKHPG
jgi:hypothetical protein